MTTAGLYRVFEYEVPPAIGAQVALADAQSLLGALHDNYGIVGLEFAKFLGAHHARLNSEVNSYFKNLETELRIQPDERFWAALITCVCLGAKYSNELKFTEIDEEGLKQFMITTLAGMRSERASQPVDMKDTMNVSNILAQFLNEMRARHTLYTNRIHTSKGKPSGIVVKRDASRLESVYVHVGLDQKLMRISSTKLSNWLGDNNYSRHIFNRALEREFKAKTVRGFIGSGTQYAVASEYLVEIDLNNSPHANFIDEA